MATPNDNSIDRRYDILRKKAEQDVRSQQQEAQKGLTRQFARLGGIGTGAFVKQQQLAQEAGAKRLGEAQQNIEFQRLADLEQQRKIEEQRKFQTSEREASQAFASQERIGAQEFASQQAELQRKFATGERVAAQDFQKGLFDIEQQNTREKLDLAMKQYNMDNNVNYLNARLQIAEGMKQGLFGFDDLNRLSEMFGIPVDQMGGRSNQGQNINLEAINKLKQFRASQTPEAIKRGYFATGAQNRYTRQAVIQEAAKMGLTESDLARAGVI